MLNEFLESCEEWHSLIIPLTASVAPHRQPVGCANHLIGFHMRAIPLTINGVKATVKQNETKELVVRSIYIQNLKCNVKNTCHFHLNLVCIPPGLTSHYSGIRGGGIKHDKSYLCQWSLTHNQCIHPSESR